MEMSKKQQKEVMEEVIKEFKSKKFRKELTKWILISYVIGIIVGAISTINVYMFLL